MNKKLKVILPISVIALSIIGAIVLAVSKPEVKTKAPEINKKTVRVMEVRKQEVTMTVKSQGSVMPRTESALVAQVSGRVTSVSPSFVTGGFFEKGDILVSIDKTDYQLAVTQAKSQVVQAELRVKLEEEQATLAIEEWKSLNGDAAPSSSLVTREPQLAEAKAALEAAKASLQLAEVNLERTNVRAPFVGRIRTKNVDVGQFVAPGNPIATVYAVDYAEVRLPLPDESLAYLNIPFDFRDKSTDDKNSKVILSATFAGKMHEWEGYIHRIEGEIDARSRMINVVARVENPYGKSKDASRPPLTLGLFVNAEIIGKTIADVAIIPRSALRDDNRVLIVDNEDQLRFREVDPLRLNAETAYIQSGIEDGERICISPLKTVVDGMPVQPFKDEG